MDALPPVPPFRIDRDALERDAGLKRSEAPVLLPLAEGGVEGGAASALVVAPEAQNRYCVRVCVQFTSKHPAGGRQAGINFELGAAPSTPGEKERTSLATGARRLDRDLSVTPALPSNSAAAALEEARES